MAVSLLNDSGICLMDYLPMSKKPLSPLEYLAMNQAMRWDAPRPPKVPAPLVSASWRVLLGRILERS